MLIGYNRAEAITIGHQDQKRQKYWTKRTRTETPLRFFRTLFPQAHGRNTYI